MNLLAIIPARSNSKRLPGKNFLSINGRSLVDRAVDIAIETAIFNEVVVTTDLTASAFDLTLHAEFDIHSRHSYLADDDVQSAAVVFDCLAKYNYRYDTFCVLNPSSPLRTDTIIRDCWREWKLSSMDCLMTMVKGGGLDFPPRHDGTVLFAKTLPFLRAMDFWKMSRMEYFIEPRESVDINTGEDFERAERILIEREGCGQHPPT